MSLRKVERESLRESLREESLGVCICMTKQRQKDKTIKEEELCPV